jgi:hypothetical protein
MPKIKYKYIQNICLNALFVNIQFLPNVHYLSVDDMDPEQDPKQGKKPKLRIRIRGLFDPWIRGPEQVFSGSRISDPKTIFLRA